MDRISSLPDEVLCQILSCLPTKQSALTSALSKRWLNLWKLVPHLDIDDSVFLHPEEGKEQREEIRQSFVDFVDRVLAMQGDSPIKKVSLKCVNGVHLDIVDRWIRNVVQRGVSDLTIFTDFTEEENNYFLPREMFFSKTLVELKLFNKNYVDWWHEVMGSSLPMLKSLYMDSDIIDCDEIDEFVPSFPVLEELRMANMEWSEFYVTVSSATLRKLILHSNGCELDYSDLVCGFKSCQNPESVSFDTPSLLYLDYSDLVSEDYPLVNMKKLVEARISLIFSEDQVEQVRAPDNDLFVVQFGNVVKLMNGILNVEKLYLLSDTLEVLSLCCDSLPVFNNLKLLSIKSVYGRGWQAVPVLIRNCPHLETLIIEGLLHHETEKCGDACDCISREDKGRSLTSCPVKKIEILGFRGTFKEMGMVKHFLDYFPCLKEMKICYVEESDPTELRNHEVSDFIVEMIEHYNKLSSCNVQLLVSE